MSNGNFDLISRFKNGPIIYQDYLKIIENLLIPLFGKVGKLKTDTYLEDNIVYPSLFHQVMSPKQIYLISALNNISAPSPMSEFKYCDLACGTAESLLKFASCFPKSQFFGIDKNKFHIDFAEEKKARLGLNNVELINADILDIISSDFPKFDFLSMVGTLSWLPLKDQIKILLNSKNLIKKNGVFLINYTSSINGHLKQLVPRIINLISEEGKSNSPNHIIDIIEKLPFLLSNNKNISLIASNELDEIKSNVINFKSMAIHDYSHVSGSNISLQDISEILSDINLNFISSAKLEYNICEFYFTENLELLNKKQKKESQILMDVISNSLTRSDLFSESNIETPLGSFVSEDLGDMLIYVSTPHWRQEIKNENYWYSFNLENKINISLLKFVSEGPKSLKEIMKLNIAEETHIFKSILLLSSIGLIDLCLKNQNESDIDSVDLNKLNDSLMESLHDPHEWIVPSNVLGDCLKFGNDEKIRFFLSLGGSGDDLFELLSNLPGFQRMNGNSGEIMNGQQLVEQFSPGLESFLNFWLLKFSELEVFKKDNINIER